MIPVATKQTEIDNLPGEEVEFTIGDPRWVMRSTADLYSNRELACVREYSTNARDSQIEAGKADLPIKVTLPTLYHPYFEVEDFGIGMSAEELKDTYTKFGTSTKRGSNDYNGMLGFGSKAAIAYTNTFTVTAVKDGYMTVAVITRKPDYSVVLKVVQESKTEQPNGVKVTIPVHNHDAFSQIARDFYRFWQPGTVLVDGKEPEWAVGEKLDENLYYSVREGTSYVVMGNVGYRIANPQALFVNKGMRSISFVAYVPNGSVEFTPSREDLKYSDHTKATLHSVIDNFEKKMVAKAKADIDTATDFFDAYSKYTYWCNKLGKGPFGDLEFKGEKFVDEVKFKGWRYTPSAQRYNMFGLESWYVSSMNQTMIVTGMTSQPNSHHKSRAKKFRDIKTINATYILFTTEDEIKSVWIDQNRVFSWDEVRDATKPPKQPRVSSHTPRVKGTFDYITKDGWKWEQEIPANANLMYISVQTEKMHNVRHVLTYFNSDAIVVHLAANRIAKFVRENPHAKEFVAEFKDKVELDGTKFLDKDTKEGLALGTATREWLRVLDVDKIKDPEFKRLKALISMDTNKKLQAYNEAHALASSMGMRYDFKRHNIMHNNDSLIKKYPLLNQLRRYDVYKDEVYLYINAKYDSVKGKKIV